MYPITEKESNTGVRQSRRDQFLGSLRCQLRSEELIFLYLSRHLRQIAQGCLRKGCLQVRKGEWHMSHPWSFRQETSSSAEIMMQEGLECKDDSGIFGFH